MGRESAQACRLDPAALGEGQIAAVAVGGRPVGVKRPVGFQVTVDDEAHRQHDLESGRRLIGHRLLGCAPATKVLPVGVKVLQAIREIAQGGADLDWRRDVQVEKVGVGEGKVAALSQGKVDCVQ